MCAGGANSGHYHAIIKDLHGQGVWDAAVASAQDAGAISSIGSGAATGGAGGGSKTAWGKIGAKLAGFSDDLGGAEYVVEDYQERPELLIRDIISQFEAMSGNPSARGMPLKQVETEISEQTGVTWNSRYKAVHGIIRDFVESKPHLFDVRNSVVSVVEGASWPDQPQARSSAQPQPACVHAPSSSGSAQSAWGSADTSGGRPSSWAKIAGKSAPLECVEKCWFDFNDMNITPVSAKEIEKYCEGAECAYVLFYRRKSQELPGLSLRKAIVPDLPSHMKAEIDRFNATLGSSRFQHTEKVSLVTVKCYPASALYFDGVVLRPHQYGCPFEIEIDRRHTFAHTRNVIYERLLQEHLRSNGAVGAREVPLGPHGVALHLLRQCVPPSVPGANDGAWHVYDLVSPDHEEAAALGTRVKDGLLVLLWDGTGVAAGWQNFRVGPESEAMALSVSYLKPSAEQHDNAPMPARSPGAEGKGVWGNTKVSAVGVVSGIGVADDDDGPPPEGERMLVRKDWTLAKLRQILARQLGAACGAVQDVGTDGASIMLHRLDRAQTLGGKQPKVLDVSDDLKTLGELDLKTVNGCWIGVEYAPSAVWQEPRAFKAFKWTHGGLTRVFVELQVPDSSTVLSTHVDVEWDILLQDLKKRATRQLKGQILALPTAQKTAIAVHNEGSHATGAKGPKKEWRLGFSGHGWGDQTYVTLVTDETASLREQYRPTNVFDDESELPPLPLTVNARIVSLANSSPNYATSNASKAELQSGSVEVRASVVSDGVRSPAVAVQLQREMLLPECRQLLARALKIEHRCSEYHMRSTNWAGDAADEITETEDATTTLGAMMHLLNIKEKELILLEPGAPRAPVPSGHHRIFVWQHSPRKRSTLVAECDPKRLSDRPDGQVKF